MVKTYSMKTKRMSKREAQRKSKVGKWVRYMSTDVGATDGIIISKGDSLEIFSPGDYAVVPAEYDQIVEVGNYVEAMNTGLTGSFFTTFYN